MGNNSKESGDACDRYGTMLRSRPSVMAPLIAVLVSWLL
jgi:hypothetical protein